MTKESELEHMRLAIREARRSLPEDDKPHPYVGVVVVRDGEVLASACRGDRATGDHAEFGALEKKLKSDKVAGCTVYTTLEPCTTRNHPKVPCAERLIERRVGRVVIGALDPDQRITGRGVLRLRRAGIAVDLFPPDLMAEVEELNRDFIRDREMHAAASVPVGLTEAGITAFYPSRDYYARLRHDAATIDRYVSTAERTLVMVSINLMTGLPFNDLCKAMERKLREKKGQFSATLSLLDPRRADLMSVVAPVLNSEPDELARAIRQSIRNLIRFKGSLPTAAQVRLDVRVHPVLPFGSAILLDHEHQNGRIQIETKPYKAGLQKSLAFEVARGRGSSGLYDVLCESYETLLRDGHSVVDENLAQEEQESSATS
ncbi:MAG: deaminase [Acidobacteria bacterium]|nr:deaminase [Acidobacteriota bacterium]